MHEGFMTRQIVENVLHESTKRGARKVVEVNLEVGELTFLNPEQMRFWYETLVKDTVLEGSKLRIKRSPGVVSCTSCSYVGPFKQAEDHTHAQQFPTLNCPRCDGRVKIVGGRDCCIRNIKLLV